MDDKTIEEILRLNAVVRECDAQVEAVLCERETVDEILERLVTAIYDDSPNDLLDGLGDELLLALEFPT